MKEYGLHHLDLFRQYGLRSDSTTHSKAPSFTNSFSCPGAAKLFNSSGRSRGTGAVKSSMVDHENRALASPLTSAFHAKG